MTVFLVVCSALLGFLIGSFLNVVIHRVPLGESVVRPASRCPGCAHPIRRRDNVPVLSWIALRGACRDCGIRISPRYPAVELLTGVVFVVLALRFGLVWELPAYLYLGAIAVALAMIDLDVHRLPNTIVLPSYLVVTVLLLVPALFMESWQDAARAALAGAVLFSFYFAIAFAYPAGMGFGDVKLAGVLGVYLGWLGWGVLLVGGFLGFLLGGVLGGALMVVGRAGRKSRIPFGPFMLGGALLAILFGQSVFDSYLDVMRI